MAVPLFFLIWLSEGRGSFLGFSAASPSHDLLISGNRLQVVLTFYAWWHSLCQGHLLAALQIAAWADMIVSPSSLVFEVLGWRAVAAGLLSEHLPSAPE